ncbi:MAG: PQQ-dependent sugar dehydrogenase [Actinomycetes bacterium]
MIGARSTRTVASALAVAGLLLAGCSGGGDDQSAGPSPSTSAPATSASPTESDSPRPSGTGRPRVTGEIAGNMEIPWGLVFLPNGSALVTERWRAQLLRVTPGGRVSTVGEVPGVDPLGEGGLLGLALAPDFESSHWLYAYFTAASDNRIVRMRYENGRLGPPDPILTGIPKGGNHNGGRIAFGPDGMLYATAGESGNPPLAQDLGSLGGKILRMTPGGRPARGNPFDNSVVWSYGHRNPQGIAWDSEGRLWASEFGQNTWDELNLIEPGGNYGWPIAEGRSQEPDLVSPQAVWATDQASPSGITIADGAVWMAALRGARLWRIPLNGDRAGDPRAFFVREYGRLRTIETAPDGSLWMATSNLDGRAQDPFPEPGDDRILRVVIE